MPSCDFFARARSLRIISLLCLLEGGKKEELKNEKELSNKIAMIKGQTILLEKNNEQTNSKINEILPPFVNFIRGPLQNM